VLEWYLRIKLKLGNYYSDIIPVPRMPRARSGLPYGSQLLAHFSLKKDDYDVDFDLEKITVAITATHGVTNSILNVPISPLMI